MRWVTGLAALLMGMGGTLLAADSAIRLGGRPKPEMRESVFSLPDGAKAVLHHPDLAEPAVPFNVTLDTAAAGSFVLTTAGQSLPIKPGVPVPVVLGGPQGPKQLRLTRGGQQIGTATVALQADTYFEAGPYTDLFRRLRHDRRRSLDPCLSRRAHSVQPDLGSRPRTRNEGLQVLGAGLDQLH